HGIQTAAGAWAEHCAAVSRRLAVDCVVLTVNVRNHHGKGLEAGAREARYAALRGNLGAGEWLLTAHHADDQLETVLLHLIRGSGMSGLAGIPRDAVFGHGRLCRPILDVPAAALAAYDSEFLATEGLHWLTDPMNADRAYDRSYVRHEVTPNLRRRFPAAAEAIGRTAILAAESAGLLDDLARGDAAAVATAHRLSLEPLRRLGSARQRNLLRWLARDRGWVTPPERRLREGLAQLLEAGPGRQPVLAWAGHEVRRFREHLHLLDVAAPGTRPTALPLAWAATHPLELGGVRGVLDLRSGAAATGLAREVVADGLEVVFRSGGERVRPGSDRHHRTLKYLFQTRGVVPWMRGHVPLIFARGQLAAVADLWVADWAAAGPADHALQLVWSGHAPIQ
ncbi:MAG: tRNA lysidine(34) synthetase TilS, partial [Gammaproteobacteria bacterium]